MTPGLATIADLTHRFGIVHYAKVESLTPSEKAIPVLGRSEQMVGICLRGTPAAMGTGIISEQEWIKLRQYLGLSQLQTEIVKRLCRGKSRHEIARDLAIGPRTVRTQTDHVCRGFGVSNQVQLVLYVLTALQELWKREKDSLCV